MPEPNWTRSAGCRLGFSLPGTFGLKFGAPFPPLAGCRGPTTPSLMLQEHPPGPVKPSRRPPAPARLASLEKLTFPNRGLPVSWAGMHMVRPDESRAHSADDNVVFLHFSTEAVKEAQHSMLGGSVWKKTSRRWVQEAGKGGGGRGAPTLLPGGSMGAEVQRVAGLCPSRPGWGQKAPVK